MVFKTLHSLDEHLKEIADLSAQSFAEGAQRSVVILISNKWLWTDVTWTTLIGADSDSSLKTEYCNAVLRAAIAEGEVYVLNVERGGKMEIASWAGFFPPGSILFGTQVFSHIRLIHFFFFHFLTKKTNSPVKLSGIWDLTNFSKNLNLN